MSMNGLVGYGSSSEDEEDDVPSPAIVSAKTPSPRDKNTNLTKTNGTSQPQQTKSVSEAADVFFEPQQGPVVGPAMPTESTVTEYEEDDYEQPSPMSERDMLRYLTQPSRPMTSLPPEPSEPADSQVTAKFKRFLELKAQGVHFNEDLASKTSFKNPGLFASLLERANVLSQAQYSSTLPTDTFSIGLFPEWAYKENLLKSQQQLNAELEATRKAQSATGKRTIEFTSAGRAEGISSHESSPGNLPKRKRK